MNKKLEVLDKLIINDSFYLNETTLEEFNKLSKLDQQSINATCFALVKEKNQPTYKVPFFQNWQDRYMFPEKTYSKKELKHLSNSSINSTKHDIVIDHDYNNVTLVDNDNLRIKFNNNNELSCVVCNSDIKKGSFLGFYHGRIHSFDKKEIIEEDKNLSDVSFLLTNKLQTTNKDTQEILKNYILTNKNSYHISKANSDTTTLITPSFYGNHLSYITLPKESEKENVSFIVTQTGENIKFIGVIAKKTIKKGDTLIGIPYNPNINTDQNKVETLELKLIDKNNSIKHIHKQLETIFTFAKEYKDKNKAFGQYFLPILYFLNFNLNDKDSHRITSAFENLIYEKLSIIANSELEKEIKKLLKTFHSTLEILTLESLEKLAPLTQKILIDLSPR